MHTQNRPVSFDRHGRGGGLLLLAQVLPQPALAQTEAPPPQAGAPDQQDRRSTNAGRTPGAVSPVRVPVPYAEQVAVEPGVAELPDRRGAIRSGPNRARRRRSRSRPVRIAMAAETELDLTTLNDTAFQGTLPQGEMYAHVAVRHRPTRPMPCRRHAASSRCRRLAATRVAAGDTQAPSTGHSGRGLRSVSTSPGVELDVAANQTASHQRNRHVPGPGRPGATRPIPHRHAGPASSRGRHGHNQLRHRRRWQRCPAVINWAEYGTWSDNSLIRPGMVPAGGAVRLGAVSGRPLGLCGSLGAGPGWITEPWGFAPFHYGRLVGDRRALGMGCRALQFPVTAGPGQVYAPGAGDVHRLWRRRCCIGAGIGASLARGNVGWVPAGTARGVYRPWYRASGRTSETSTSPMSPTSPPSTATSRSTISPIAARRRSCRPTR